MTDLSGDVLLTRYGRPHQHLRLNVATGAFTITRSPNGAACGVGEAMRRLGGRRIACALYEQDGVAWFQAGSDRWPQPELRGSATHRVGRFAVTAEFHLSREGRELFRIRYWVPWVGLMGNIDPTYDGLDHGTDDFLFNATARLNHGG
jgi:hypothetical protein